MFTALLFFKLREEKLIKSFDESIYDLIPNLKFRNPLNINSTKLTFRELGNFIFLKD
jgi:hypothetical protein